MSPVDHGARQLAGAWKMAFNAADWRRSLDRATDDVFASFAAIAVAAPLIALFTISAKRAAARLPDFGEAAHLAAPLGALVVGDLVVHAADWAASLAILLFIARATGAGKQAADLIVGFNWIQPMIAAAKLPAIAVAAATANSALGGLVGLPAFALTLALIWGIVRRGLGAKPAAAAAVVVLLILVGAVIAFLGAGALRAMFPTQG